MSWSDADDHPGPELSRFVDGELADPEARAVADHLEDCTECAREVALYRALGSAMREETRDESVWGSVSERIARSLGWLFVLTGAAVLTALALVEWFRGGALTLEWWATTGAGVGLALLAVSVGWEQYRKQRDSPYRDVQR